MSLNHGKCVSLMHNFKKQTNIMFKDWRELQIADEAEYLGTQLNDKLKSPEEYQKYARSQKTRHPLEQGEVHP